jgi:AbrB family looped-hinge helix DNA binding protein
MEEFVARVFTGGKVTIPKQLRERFNLKEEDYVRLSLVEVLKKDASGEWSKKKVQ